MRISVFILSLLFSFSSLAQILAPSAEEVRFSYEAEFVAAFDAEVEDLVEDLAAHHASHLFGLFHSHRLIAQFGLSPYQVGGIASPRSDNEISVLGSERRPNGKVFIRYRNEGKFLVHKKVSASLLKTGSLDLPLPYDMTKIYDPKCTDDHYDSEGDYWYFYDAFRQGCERLSLPPLAKLTRIKIAPMPQRKVELNPRIDLLRGANGNGSAFTLSIIHGFAETPKTKGDEGRDNYRQLHRYLLSQGFTAKYLVSSSTNPLRYFEKEITLENGKKIQVQIQSLLVNTSITSRSKKFAEFFKAAVEQSDVVIYAGHSGLGGNLDVASLEAKAGQYVFNQDKRQIFYFDSCASYAYYLHMFASAKRKAKIDVMTNGLSSYFHTGPVVLHAFLDALLSPSVKSPDWMTIMQNMEKPLAGGTYMLNVGGI